MNTRSSILSIIIYSNLLLQTLPCDTAAIATSITTAYATLLVPKEEDKGHMSLAREKRQTRFVRWHTLFEPGREKRSTSSSSDNSHIASPATNILILEEGRGGDKVTTSLLPQTSSPDDASPLLPPLAREKRFLWVLPAILAPLLTSVGGVAGATGIAAGTVAGAAAATTLGLRVAKDIGKLTRKKRSTDTSSNISISPPSLPHLHAPTPRSGTSNIAPTLHLRRQKRFVFGIIPAIIAPLIAGASSATAVGVTAGALGGTAAAGVVVGAMVQGHHHHSTKLERAHHEQQQQRRRQQQEQPEQEQLHQEQARLDRERQLIEERLQDTTTLPPSTLPPATTTTTTTTSFGAQMRQLQAKLDRLIALQDDASSTSSSSRG